MPSSRRSWDETWMDIALVMSSRGNCSKVQVGAIIVDARNRLVATGYNGPPGGLDQTCRLDCPRFLGQDHSGDYGACLTIHAEANALLFCDRREREGGTIYISSSACKDCAKLIANSGLGRVVMRRPPGEEYRNPAAVGDYLALCGLEVVWAH